MSCPSDSEKNLPQIPNCTTVPCACPFLHLQPGCDRSFLSPLHPPFFFLKDSPLHCPLLECLGDLENKMVPTTPACLILAVPTVCTPVPKTPWQGPLPHKICRSVEKDPSLSSPLYSLQSNFPHQWSNGVNTGRGQHPRAYG